MGPHREFRRIDLINAREANMRLDRNGFELRHRPVSLGADTSTTSDIIGDAYYKDCEDLVKEATGAAAVLAFHKNSRAGKPRYIDGSKVEEKVEGVSRPVTVRHTDFTYDSSKHQVKILGRPRQDNDYFRMGSVMLSDNMKQMLEAPGARYALINVWRSTQADPIEAYPLSCVDAQTIEPYDLATQVFKKGGKSVHETYLARHNPNHKNYFYPRQTRDEALLFKCWDCWNSRSDPGQDGGQGRT